MWRRIPFYFPLILLHCIKSVLDVGVAMLTGIWCLKKCLFACTWFNPVTIDCTRAGSSRGHAVLVWYKMCNKFDHAWNFAFHTEVHGSGFQRVKLYKSFFLKFLEDISHFVGPLIPLFSLLVTSVLDCKARVDFSLLRFLACTLFIRFTSGATPADCIYYCSRFAPEVSKSKFLWKLLNFGECCTQCFLVPRDHR